MSSSTPAARYAASYQAGRARYAGGDGGAAAQQWQATLALTSTEELAAQPEVVYGLARLAADRQDSATARALYEQAIAIAPQYRPARLALLALARNESRWADAEAQLVWFVANRPGPAAQLQLADVLARQNKNAEAEAVLLPLANDNNDQALAALGALYQAAGRSAAAATVFERALAANPRNADAYEGLAKLAQDGSQPNLALAECYHGPQPNLALAECYLRQALQIEPGRVAARVALGQVLVKQARPADAAREFQAAVEIRSTDPLVYRELGEVLLASGQPGPAADSFQRAIQLAPNSHEAHHGLAMAYFRQNRLDDARAEENRTLELANGNYTLALVGLGDIELVAGNRDAAVKNYTVALERDANIVGAYVGLGQAALQQGVPEVARGHFQRGLIITPTVRRS